MKAVSRKSQYLCGSYTYSDILTEKNLIVILMNRKVQWILFLVISKWAEQQEGDYGWKIENRVVIMIKNLVFDLGNVLIERNSEKILTYLNLRKSSSGCQWQVISSQVSWHQTDKEKLSLKEACEKSGSVGRFYHSAIKNIFYHWYEVVHVYSDLQERIRLWADQGYRIYILSTTCDFYHIKKKLVLLYLPHCCQAISFPQRSVLSSRKQRFTKKLLKKWFLVSRIRLIDDIQANLDTAAELGFETIYPQSETENIRAMGLCWLWRKFGWLMIVCFTYSWRKGEPSSTLTFSDDCAIIVLYMGVCVQSEEEV